MTRRLLIVSLGAAVLAATPAPALAKRAEVLVVGKSGVLRGPKSVPLEPRTVKVGHKRCAVGRATPLSLLVATKLRLRLRDQGSCSKDARDAGALYVAAVAGQRESGHSGWVYKVGNRVGTTGAGDPSGPFGTGKRLRSGQKVLWFWCMLNRAGGCQRTLDARPDRSHAGPGEPLSVTVRGYDDQGKGVLVPGATVRLGTASALTGADGTAVLTVPAGHGRMRLRAEHAGMTGGFPREVAVG